VSKAPHPRTRTGTSLNFSRRRSRLTGIMRALADSVEELAAVREDVARRRAEAQSSYFPRRVDHSGLVEILLWEGSVEAAWRGAKEGGCSDELWLALADRRAWEHPEDSLSIYEARIEPLVEQTNNAAYEQAYEILLKTRSVMNRLGREQEFEEYVQLLQEEYKRKRNFMKLLDGME